MALFYGKFDANAYYAANPDVKKEKIKAEQHWALSGIRERRAGYLVGLALGGQFDATGYLNCNPDVRNAGLNAREHYTKSGWAENRDICLWVDATFEPSGTWLHLAKEGEKFSVTGTKIVRYGAATQWVTKEISGSGQCTKEFFGIDPTFGIIKSCQVLVSGPKPGVTWSRVGSEGDKITLDGTRTVRYGAGTQWIMKLLSGSVECTAAFFGGDPAPGIPKICEVLGPDEMNGTWQRIATEGQKFSIIGAQTIRYGDGTHWITKVLAGMGTCTAAFFGGDPAPGIDKYCEGWIPALIVSPVAALDFDGGDDYVEVFEVNVPTYNYTIEAWIKPDKMNGGIVGWGDRDHKSQEVGLRLSKRVIIHRWWNSELFLKVPNLVGKWHHVAATFDGKERCVYLDGKLLGKDIPAQGQKVLSEADPRAGKKAIAERHSEAEAIATDWRRSHKVPRSANFRIGLADLADQEYYFDGNLGEIRIWDRARSKDEIVDDMAHRLTGDKPGLIAYWRLNNRGEVNEHIIGATWEFDDSLERVIDPSYYYRLTTMWQGDGKSLHILNDGRNNLPVLAGTGDYASQYWKLTPLGKNYYRLTNRWLGPQKSLDIINDGVNNNKPIMADTGNYSGQFLKLTLFQNGYYRISTQWQGEGKSLDIVNDGQNNQPILADTGNVSGQYWKLTRADVIVGDKDGIGLSSAPEYNGEVCSAQSEGCVSQGCASQGGSNCAAQACLAQTQGCTAQGCPAQVQGCAAQGCIAQAEGCAAQGCAAQVQGCAGQGCVAQAQGCAAQGCAAQAEGCAAQACAAQAQGCAAQGCAAQAGGCAAQGCAAQAGGCAAQGCAAQAGGCAAQGCAGDAGCAVAGCAVDACAAHGCAGQACAVDIGAPCAADGQLGPCAIDVPYCPFIL